jgi:hypothetical protein
MYMDNVVLHLSQPAPSGPAYLVHSSQPELLPGNILKDE